MNETNEFSSMTENEIYKTKDKLNEIKIKIIKAKTPNITFLVEQPPSKKYSILERNELIFNNMLKNPEINSKTPRNNLKSKILLNFSKAASPKRFSNAVVQNIENNYLTNKQIQFVNDLTYLKDNGTIQKEKLKKKLFDLKADTIRKALKFNIINIIKNLYWNFKRKIKTVWLKFESNEKCLKLAKYLKILFKVQMPDNPFRLTIDFFCLTFVLIEIIIIPLIISFPDANCIEIEYFQRFTSIFFMIDVIMNFNVAFYLRGNLIVKRSKIAKNYLKKWFFFDVISSFPFDWILMSFEDSEGLILIFVYIKSVRILKLLRAFKLHKLLNRLEDYFQFPPSITAILACIRLFFLLIFIAHWLACIWHMLGIYEDNYYGITWIKEQNMIDQDWTEKYVISIYWAITTMITVGYGDITPVTKYERIFTVFCMVIACGIFGYIMNRIGNIFSSFEENSLEFKTKLFQINNFMKRKNIPKSIQVRVRKYVQFTFDPEKRNQIDESTFFKSISKKLQDEIIDYTNGNIIKQYSFFSKVFSNRLIKILPFLIKENNFGPDEMIIDSKHSFFKEKSLYLMEKGLGSLFFDGCYVDLAVIEQGNMFGQIGFFTNFNYNLCVKSLDFSNVFTLKRNDLLDLLFHENLRIDKEILLEIKDKIELYNNFNCIELNCFSCKSQTHLIDKCPYIHYNVTNEEIFFKNRAVERQFFKGFVRANRGKKNARKDITIIQSSAQALLSIILIYNESGFKLWNTERINVNNEELINEEVIGIKKVSEKIQNFKDRNDFDKLVHLKEFNSNIINFSPKNSNNSPRNSKNINSFPTRSSNFKIKFSDFNENDSNHSSEKTFEHIEHNNLEQRINEISQYLKKSNKIQGESFEIDKIEIFKKYFIHNNFDEIIKKYNINLEKILNSAEKLKEKEILDKRKKSLRMITTNLRNATRFFHHIEKEVNNTIKKEDDKIDKIIKENKNINCDQNKMERQNEKLKIDLHYTYERKSSSCDANDELERMMNKIDKNKLNIFLKKN